MAGATITLTAENGAAVLDTLRRLTALGGRLQPVFADIGESLLLSHEDRWDREVAPDGSPWQPLNERYRQRKLAKGKPDKILVLDQHLKNLNYHATDPGLELGTPWIYGATHQFGAAERGIPARPFLGLDAGEQEMVLEVLQEALAEALGGVA